MLRMTVIVLAAAEVLLGIAFVSFMLQASDPMGKSIGQGMALLVALPLLGLSVPALLLALFDRWTYAALALALLAVPVVVVLWGMA